MKLEDCKIGMKVRVLGKTIWGDKDTNGKRYPAHERGWGYIKSSYKHPGCANDDTVYLAATFGGIVETGVYSPNDLEPYEAEETEYRQLKDITPRAIFRAGSTTFSFMNEFIHLVSVFRLDYEEVLPLGDLLFEIDVDPGLADLLIRLEFIEKVVPEPKEITYTYGNKLVDDKGEIGVIVQVGARQVCIIHDNNRWVEPISVSNVTCITAEEFKVMQGDFGTWRKDK